MEYIRGDFYERFKQAITPYGRLVQNHKGVFVLFSSKRYENLLDEPLDFELLNHTHFNDDDNQFELPVGYNFTTSTIYKSKYQSHDLETLRDILTNQLPLKTLVDDTVCSAERVINATQILIRDLKEDNSIKALSCELDTFYDLNRLIEETYESEIEKLDVKNITEESCYALLTGIFIDAFFRYNQMTLNYETNGAITTFTLKEGGCLILNVKDFTITLGRTTYTFDEILVNKDNDYYIKQCVDSIYKVDELIEIHENRGF